MKRNMVWLAVVSRVNSKEHSKDQGSDGAVITGRDCICCTGAAEYHFRALEIHTLHIRDIKEKRVQALGRSVQLDICSSCACAQLEMILKGTGLRDILPFAFALIFGTVVSVLFWSGEAVFRLCGAAGVICGILGIAGTAREDRQRRERYSRLSREKSLEAAAWETAVRCADHKQGDHDLTYIPVTQDTLSMKNGDLMVAYDLLPEIAVQAWDMMHRMSI